MDGAVREHDHAGGRVDALVERPQHLVDRARIDFRLLLAFQAPHADVERMRARDHHRRDGLGLVGALVVVDRDQPVHEGARRHHGDVPERAGRAFLFCREPAPAEALGVAHDRVELGALDRGEHAGGFAQVGRERLLDQHRQAVLDRRHDRIDMEMLVGRDNGARRLRPRQQLAVVGGDEIGPDLGRHRAAAVGVAFRDADPLDRRMPGRDLAPEQADAARPHDGEPDALGLAVFHVVLLVARRDPIMARARRQPMQRALRQPLPACGERSTSAEGASPRGRSAWPPLTPTLSPQERGEGAEARQLNFRYDDVRSAGRNHPGVSRVSDLVSYRRDGTIGVVTIDNPPVNALKNAVRAALVAAFAEAKADAGTEAVVLACAGRTFVAGADISEFGKPPMTPTTGDVIAAIESVGMPVVAALHGTALGGGLELALGCHFRVAAPGTRLGQAEIKLGIIPGAGGTQRLPRLVGIETALGMILWGDPISAQDALRHGLIDASVAGDVTAAAIAFARRAVAEKRPAVPARERDDKLAPARRDRAKFEELATAHIKRAKGLRAPAAAIESVRNALDLPFDEALRRERAMFQELVVSPEAKAQRHIFFAEREAAKLALPDGTKAREIKRAAVIGAGTMGGGIAMCFASAGIPVTVVEASPDALARGLATIAKNYRSTAARGGLPGEEAERRIGLIQGATDMAAGADADLIVEAVFEEMDVKAKVFARSTGSRAPTRC